MSIEKHNLQSLQVDAELLNKLTTHTDVGAVVIHNYGPLAGGEMLAEFVQAVRQYDSHQRGELMTAA